MHGWDSISIKGWKAKCAVLCARRAFEKKTRMKWRLAGLWFLILKRIHPLKILLREYAASSQHGLVFPRVSWWSYLKMIIKMELYPWEIPAHCSIFGSTMMLTQK